MAIGPVEYIVVGFPGNEFNGKVAPALAKLIESNTIRLLDLLFVGKDADGNVLAIEFDPLPSHQCKSIRLGEQSADFRARERFPVERDVHSEIE